MEYKTTEKTLILLSPAELMLIPPKYSLRGKNYYDVPDDCIVVDIRRVLEEEKEESSKPPSKPKKKYQVIGIEILVRYNADLSKLEQVISIAQEHNVYILYYKVESMKMLRKVSDLVEGYNFIKKSLDDMDLKLDFDTEI